MQEFKFFRITPLIEWDINYTSYISNNQKKITEIVLDNTTWDAIEYFCESSKKYGVVTIQRLWTCDGRHSWIIGDVSFRPNQIIGARILIREID